MAGPLSFLPNLAGTLLQQFRIGVNKLENIGGVLTSRTNAGADAPIAASQAQLKGATYKTTLAPAASGQGADLTFELPAADGATNQVLGTDGAGKLGFITVATGANAVKADDQLVPFNASSPLTVIALPAGATVQKVTVEVETAFDGTPALSIGVAGDVSRYLATTQVELGVEAIYEVSPMIEEALAVSPIVTYAQNGATVGSARVTIQWALPG